MIAPHLAIGSSELPLLIYVSGWMSNAAAARPFLAPLAGDYHCFCPELPGTGAMPWEPVGNSTAAYARWVIATVDQFYPDRPFVLVGNSMGGMIAQEIALLSPQRITALVCLATTAYFCDTEHQLPEKIWRAFLAYRTITSPKEFTLGVLPYLLSFA